MLTPRLSITFVRLLLGTLSCAAILNSATTLTTYAQADTSGTPAAQVTANTADYVMRVELEASGRDDEWVLIALKANPEDADSTMMGAYHTTTFVSNNFLTRVLNGAIDAVSPIPVPFNFTDSDGSQHETQYIAFTPDSCQSGTFLVENQGLDQGLDISDCTISGRGFLTLPADVDIRSGLITVVYTEGNLTRSVAFRIDEQAVDVENEDELENLCEQYPLNSRCRYLPLSQEEEESD